MTYGLDMGLVGYLVAGTFVTVFYYPFFWVQIAFIVALHNITKNKVGLIDDKAISSQHAQSNKATVPSPSGATARMQEVERSGI